MDNLALGPRSRRRLEQRDALLRLALATVVERGVDSLSMNKLAKEAGFTPGALYRYFDSKDALVAELAQRMLDDLCAAMARARAAHHQASGCDRLWAYVTTYAHFSQQEPHAFGLLSLLVAHPQVLLSASEHAAPVAAKLPGVIAPIVEALDDAQREGALSDGDGFERALALFAAVQGALQLRKQERHPGLGIDADDLVQQLVSTLLRGWSP